MSFDEKESSKAITDTLVLVSTHWYSLACGWDLLIAYSKKTSNNTKLSWTNETLICWIMHGCKFVRKAATVDFAELSFANGNNLMLNGTQNANQRSQVQSAPQGRRIGWICRVSNQKTNKSTWPIPLFSVLNETTLLSWVFQTLVYYWCSMVLIGTQHQLCWSELCNHEPYRSHLLPLVKTTKQIDLNNLE